MDAGRACQACANAPAMDDDALCAACATPVQLSWGVAHSRGAQRGEDVRWDGRRRPVEIVQAGDDLL
ncbi:MAG TPA: hypothetical protein VE081_01360 [Sporichthyaceae bacterium]|nr:hypothetical protein [Sporichthyaceae bacterium]